MGIKKGSKKLIWILPPASEALSMKFNACSSPFLTFSLKVRIFSFSIMRTGFSIIFSPGAR